MTYLDSDGRTQSWAWPRMRPGPTPFHLRISEKEPRSRNLSNKGGPIICREIFSLCSLFIMSAVVLMTPLVAQSDPLDLEEVARMKVGPQKLERVVIDRKSDLYTVKTSTGATLTLAEAAAVRTAIAYRKSVMK